MSGDEMELPAAKDVAKHILDKSLYALGLFSHISLTEDTSLLFNVERHGEKKGPRSKATLIHRLPDHDITVEAAWPELFLDSKGTYWEVPASASLDIASLISPSGLRYRFGLHKNSGHPEALNSSSDGVPLSLIPGLCAKAAFSYEKSRDLWREHVTKSPEEEEEPAWLSSYDIQLKEPHAAISGIIGGTCAAWFGGNKNISIQSKKRDPFSVDLFGSLCYTFQHGKFKNDFNDLSRVDARLDICSASSFIKGTYNIVSDIFKSHADREVDPLASPKLNVLFQQQVAGPIVFRVDSRVSLGSPSRKHIPHVEDVIYGLSYSFRMLESGKILAWFSPKRKEAMIELRFYEFDTPTKNS
ncbi:protein TRIGALACTOSYLDIACYLGLYCEROL 4, chloroplastic [Iris pallida]|uniref:Protein TRIGALACTOSYLDIACYLGLYCEROL 4, chloroplastic n=1 Tax=Iris pallida TaxID=29817 RepID=A0AAX6G1S9_IRIPA|nr:protein TRIGALACTOSYLDIACYLGLYCEROL 4, chloroplastic [Iris pallida]